MFVEQIAMEERDSVSIWNKESFFFFFFLLCSIIIMSPFMTKVKQAYDPL